MVMKPGPFFEAVEALGATSPIVLMSARGRQFTHADAVRFAAGTELTLLCGHYKDVDQRVADHLATEELSLGDFVLSGGEPAALAVIDATVRLLPGAMSDHDSARTDSFYDRELSAPSYTRPPEYRGHAVPEVLLSGDHKKIDEWRQRRGRTPLAAASRAVVMAKAGSRRTRKRAATSQPTSEPSRRVAARDHRRSAAHAIDVDRFAARRARDADRVRAGASRAVCLRRRRQHSGQSDDPAHR